MQQIGEATERRHAAPITSISLWALVWGAVVLIVRALTPEAPALLGPYRSGIITLAVFLLAALYSARKRLLWLSVQFLSLAIRLPRPLAKRAVVMDRNETWRVVHVAIGVLAMLPFWWHMDAGPATTLEAALAAAVILMVVSGFLGTVIQNYLPHLMRLRPGQEVRVQDAEAAMTALYVQAEEQVLGHSEQLVQAYVAHIRPILLGSHSAARFLWATLSGGDPAPAIVAPAREQASAAGADAQPYAGLLELAERKVRLEHNRFNLRLSTGWLKFHIGLAILVGVLIVFHVLGALYFRGI